MAQTIGFGDLLDPSQQNQQQGQGQQQGQQQSSAPSQTPGAGQQGSVSQAGASQANSGTQGTGGGTTGAQAGSQYKPANYSQQTQGTGFTNLQSYLNANNPTQLQNAVVQNIGSQNQATSQALGSSQQQFQQGLQQNQANTGANQGLVQNVLNNPLGYSNANGSNVAGAGQSAVNAPIAQGAQPNLAQGTRFSQLISGQYGGPTGLAGADQLSAQGSAAAQQAANLGSASGRTSILQGLMANPNYTQGQSALDSAILGSGNQTALNQAANQSRGLQNIINTAASGAQAQGQEAGSNAQQFGQQVQGQLTNQVQGQLAGLQNQAVTDQQANNAAYAQMQKDIQSGSVTQQEANMLGLQQGENLFGVDLSTYLQQNPLQANASNVATAQQYAQMQALKQLSGSASPTAANSVFQQFANPAQAGAFTSGPVATGNLTAAEQQIANTQASYQQQLAALEGSMPGGVDIGSIGNGNNGFLAPVAVGAAAGSAAGSQIAGQYGGAVGGFLGGVGGLLSSGNSANAAAQARESAKQAESAQLQSYLQKVNTLAGQYGMNTGRFQNMTDAQKAAQFDPQNVGANYGEILREINNSLRANNTVNVLPGTNLTSAGNGSSAIGPQLSGMLTDNANAFNVS